MKQRISVKTTLFHVFFKKKQCRFKWHYSSSSSPGSAIGEEKLFVFFFCFFSSLPPPPPTLMVNLKINVIWHHFLLNETAHFSQNDTISYFF
jgi:hypothetical protein